jgi:hypothetical protein
MVSKLKDNGYKPTSIKMDIVKELHKPARKKFKRRRIIIKGLNETLQADLVEMIPYAKENQQFKYILVDCFSKYVWMAPLKTKNSIDVSTAMENILLKVKPPPKNLQTDNGKECFNTKFQSLMKKRKIRKNVKLIIIVRSVLLKHLKWVQVAKDTLVICNSIFSIFLNQIKVQRDQKIIVWIEYFPYK